MIVNMLKILLVDDHAIVREGLRKILESSGEMICTESNSGEEALQLIESGIQFDAVLLDISLPGISGLEVLTGIHARCPHLPVLLVSMHSEEQYAVRAMRMGAAGYLCKNTAPEEIERVVKSVAHGDIYLSRATANQMTRASGADAIRPLHESLSDREFTIMRMIGTGKSVSEIALALNLSVKTVSTYRERVLEKMKFTNNYDIVRYVLQEGLIE